MENSLVALETPVLPNVSADVVEEAKEFAATIVRPEVIVPAQPVIQTSTPEETVAEHAEQRAEVEEVAVLDSAVLTQIAENPEIAAALAAEGLQIDQNEVARALEENKRRRELETVLAPHASITDLNQVFIPEDRPVEQNLEPVTPESIHELKTAVNSSFEEVASLLLEHQRQIDEIEARLAEHNKRGGHKI